MSHAQNTYPELEVVLRIRFIVNAEGEHCFYPDAIPNIGLVSEDDLAYWASYQYAVDRITEMASIADAFFGRYGIRVRIESISDWKNESYFEINEDYTELMDVHWSPLQRWINVYFVYKMGPGIGGVAWLRPFGWNPESRGSAIGMAAHAAGATTLAHELGHYFGLPHTIELGESDEEGDEVEVEMKREFRENAMAPFPLDTTLGDNYNLMTQLTFGRLDEVRALYLTAGQVNRARLTVLSRCSNFVRESWLRENDPLLLPRQLPDLAAGHYLKWGG